MYIFCHCYFYDKTTFCCKLQYLYPSYIQAFWAVYIYTFDFSWPNGGALEHHTTCPTAYLDTELLLELLLVTNLNTTLTTDTAISII